MKRYVVPVLRKSLVLIIGVPIIIVGVILVPLPGPGLLVMLLGFLVLALEFEWAQRHRDRLKGHLKTVIDKSKPKDKN